MTTNNNNRLDEAYQILISLGLPRGQHNERSALCLLAQLNLTVLVRVRIAYLLLAPNLEIGSHKMKL